jgi:tetratricopeptide (TPR) repeat protein
VAESGAVSGVLGTESDSSAEGSPPEISTPLDPTAAALAAEAAKNDPELAEEASDYFRKQSRLVEIQTEHLHEQRAVNLQLLKLRRFDERLRVGLRLFVILVATIIGIGGVILIHDAVTSRSVVIEPFETPAALVERGLTGTVVASSVLDQLTRLQAATRSLMQRRDLSNAWFQEIKLTVPEAGISIGEISQLLKARFSHDIHVSGDVVQAQEGGLEVTVRGDGLLPQTFSGASDQLAKLTTEAAEYVYAQSQPALWAQYLIDSGRYQEAIQFCKMSIGSSSGPDRPVLLTYWATAIAQSSGTGPQALALVEWAIRLQPDYWSAYNVWSGLQNLLGHEEDVWKMGENMRKIAGGRPGRAPEFEYSDVDWISWNLPAELAALTSNASASFGAGTFPFAVGPAIALTYAEMHDPTAAELALQMTRPDANDPSISASAHAVRGMLAAESGEAAQSVSEWEAFLLAYSDPAVSWADPGLHCWVAPAEEAAGHPDKADAVLKSGGTFVDCYRFRGDILDQRGDWAMAQKAYTEAVALAPDLPAGYYSWGLALAKHEDLVGAEAKLREANKCGPHWADPLKAWGDVLVKQGKIKEALARYDEALKYAPNWKQLKEAREAAAKQRS